MTEIVAILNVTPDSFSDGGRNFSPQAAMNALAQFIRDGAHIIDIGAESTRPGAKPLTPAEEWQRLEPILTTLPKTSVRFSVDTRHAENAEKALALGVHWINDVSGFSDPAMVAAVKSSDCKLVFMHSLTVPADLNIVMPESEDVMETLIRFATARIAALEAAGIARERIIFDPGIGFGKSAAQSLHIVNNIARFRVLGVPLFVGHSRKAFLTQLAVNRDVATLVLSQQLAAHGVQYLRVHEVARHKQLLAMKAMHG